MSFRPDRTRTFDVDFDDPGSLAEIASFSDFDGTLYYFAEGCDLSLGPP